MKISEIKEKLYSYINSTNDENVLINLLDAVEGRNEQPFTNEEEDLSKKDYKELMALVNEPPEKDTISYAEFKSSLSKWFTK